MGHSIIISSGKGGVGKTSVAVNLGIALSRLGKRVALIDGSLTTPDVSLHLKIPFQVMGLAHVLKGEARLGSACFRHSSGLTVIPGTVHVDILKEIKGKKFARLLNELKRDYDYVLIDGSAGLGTEALSVMRHCDRMLVVTNPELASVVNSSKAIQVAKNLDVEPVGVILNRLGRFKQELGEEKILPLLYDTPIIARIPEDRRLPMATHLSGSILDLYPNSRTSREFRSLASYVCGEDAGERESLFTRMRSLIRRSIFW